ncbi:MAG: TIGR00266 family protein [Bacteroidota bacterium]
MQSHELLYTGAFALLKASLAAGQSLKAESGAMVSMDATIEVAGKMEGGLLGGITRMVSGEKFFFQTLTANGADGEVLLAPASPGDITHIAMDGSTTYNVQKDGFLAGSQDLEVSTKMQNLAKGLFSGEGFFIVKVSGTGDLFVNSFGAIHRIDLPAGKDYIVDNGHLVAWADTLQYKVQKASKGWISSFTSGEGLVTRFTGPGSLYIQSRNAPAFGSWIRPYIPIKDS